MYLSRIPLDVNKRQTQVALYAPNKIHGAIENSFTEYQKRNLWRIDVLDGHTYLMILSEEIPNLIHIASQFGFMNNNGETKDYNPLLERIKNGTYWQFRLAANPRRHIVEKKDCAKAVASAIPNINKEKPYGTDHVIVHSSEKHQLEWIYKKSKMCGFSIVPNTIRIMENTWIDFKKHKTNNRVSFLRVVYEGILKVEDFEQFKNALTNGIGSEKAYGMGMLTVMKKENINEQHTEN